MSTLPMIGFTQTRRGSGWTGRLGLVALAMLLPARHLFALDPTRTLSQAVHRIWQVQQGLPEATVYAVAQSADGYLWLGTETGLVRFDGVRFTVVDHLGDLRLAPSRVQAFAIDAAKAMWIGTGDAGAIRVDGAHATRFAASNGLPSDDVRCAVAGSNGQVWLCTSRGLASVSSAGVATAGVPAAWMDRDVNAACVAPDGSVWIAGDEPVLGVWHDHRFDTHALSSVTRTTTVHALVCGTNGVVWAGTSDGLVRLSSAGGERRFTTADGLPSDTVLSLAATREGAVLAGTTNGFSRIVDDVVDSFRAQDGLSQSTVYGLFEDREGSVWVATKHGLNQFLDGRAVPYTTAEGLPSNDTGPIAQDAKGRIWVGTIGSGLGRADERHAPAITTRDGLASNVVLSLAIGRQSDLWVGTDHGLQRFDDGHAMEHWAVPGDRVRALRVDGTGAVWIATPDGLDRLAPGGGDPAPVMRGAIAALGGRAHDGVIVAPEAGGLDTVTADGAVRVMPGASSLRHVDALYEDDDGLLWIGTTGDGLRLLDHGQLVAFHTRDGLFDDVIYGIVADDHDRLWMACSKGIFSVSRADLRRVAAGGLRTFVSTPYSPTDALRTIECKAGVQPAVWRMRDGSIWFSTIRGLLTLDPAHLERRIAAPPAVIEEVTVDGATADPGTPIALSSGARNVEFRYTGLSFVVPTRLTFRYRLVGFDPAWIDAGPRRQAFYTNLPPAHFEFLVKACLPDGPCTEEPSGVAIAKAPRLYQRLWFAPLVAFALAGLIYGAYQWRIQRLRANFALVLAERARIARELHDTLVQGFAGIAMATKALTVRLPAGSTERGTLEEIVDDAAECLREARRTLAGLRNPELGLTPSVEQAARQLTHGTDIALRLSLDRCRCPVPASTEYQLVRIAQEAITNAVKHSNAQSLEVSLESTPQRLRLRVKDDGRGFDGAAEPPGHYGLIGMRERASQIGADFELTSGPGLGTAVSVIWTSEA